jgi:signal transduction histidine kinase
LQALLKGLFLNPAMPLNHLKLASVLLLSIAGFQAVAQQISVIDSLKKLLPSRTGVERFDLLNDIGFQYRLSSPDSTILYCLEAYALGEELELKKNLSRPLSFIGLANAYKGDYKTSFEYHARAIEVAQQQQDSVQLAFSYNNFGRLFFDQGDLTRAYDNLILSQTIFEKLNDPAGLAYVYRSLSSIYKSQKDYPKALEFSLKAYTLRKELAEPRGLLSALMELGSVYSEMKYPAEANRCFEQADSIATEINDLISKAEIQIGWGEYLLSYSDTSRAHDLAHQAYAIVVNTDNQRLIPRAALLMGHVHFELNGLEPAKEYLKKVIDMTGDTHLDLQRDAYLYLSKVYEKEGKRTDATFAYNRYLILKESLQSVELTRQLEKLQFQLAIERIERENEMLKANEARSEAIILQQKLGNIVLFTVAAFVSVLLFMQWRNARKRNAINTKLEEQNQQIEKQAKEIAEKNEKLEKRNKELSELNHEKDTLMNIVAHDLKSPLNRIKGLSDLIEMDGSLNPNQSKYMGLLKDSTRSGLDLIVDLLDVSALEANREPSYSFFELDSFLRDRVNAFQHYASTKSIDLVFRNSITEMVYLDQDYMVRILDNLISNAIKFSPKGSMVSVGAEMKEGYCSIQVKDEGPGFGPDDMKFLYQKFRRLSARPTGGESSNGLGLTIVKILVERLGGEIVLHTRPGGGSTFELLFPVKKNVLV